MNRLNIRADARNQTFFETTKDQKVLIKKTTSKDIVYLKALESTLSEWDSKYDDEDYCDL